MKKYVFLILILNSLHVSCIISNQSTSEQQNCRQSTDACADGLSCQAQETGQFSCLPTDELNDSSSTPNTAGTNDSNDNPDMIDSSNLGGHDVSNQGGHDVSTPLYDPNAVLPCSIQHSYTGSDVAEWHLYHKDEKLVQIELSDGRIFHYEYDDEGHNSSVKMNDQLMRTNRHEDGLLVETKIFSEAIPLYQITYEYQDQIMQRSYITMIESGSIVMDYIYETDQNGCRVSTEIFAPESVLEPRSIVRHEYEESRVDHGYNWIHQTRASIFLMSEVMVSPWGNNQRFCRVNAHREFDRCEQDRPRREYNLSYNTNHQLINALNVDFLEDTDTQCSGRFYRFEHTFDYDEEGRLLKIETTQDNASHSTLVFGYGSCDIDERDNTEAGTEAGIEAGNQAGTEVRTQGSISTITNGPCSDTPQGCPEIEWVHFNETSYSMGSDSFSWTQPIHQVTVPSFEIMKTEVTVGMYRKCVNAGVCIPITETLYCNWHQSDKEDHPINCIRWIYAKVFAEWVGGSLPSEAQWELAARGGDRDVLYPWGNEAPSCFLTTFNRCNQGTTRVCSNPAGHSIDGLCDLAGNVYEWLADRWHNNYEGAPNDGTAWAVDVDDPGGYVLRGGGWNHGEGSLRVFNRQLLNVTYHDANLIGLRVVRPVP